MKKEILKNLESIKNNWKKIEKNWIVKLIKLLISSAIIVELTKFVVIMLIKALPQSFVQDAMSIYNGNSTMAEMHVSVANNLLLSAITFVYVLLTWNLAKESKNAVTQSKEAIVQSRKEQQIRDIENRLEKFYMPAQSILKVAVEFLKDTIHFTKWTDEVSSCQRGNHSQSTTGEEDANTYAAEKLKEIEKYRFLAKEKTCRSLIKFIYENESTENRLEFSNCVQEDIKDYLAKLYELKEE